MASPYLAWPCGGDLDKTDLAVADDSISEEMEVTWNIEEILDLKDWEELKGINIKLKSHPFSVAGETFNLVASFHGEKNYSLFGIIVTKDSFFYAEFDCHCKVSVQNSNNVIANFEFEFHYKSDYNSHWVVEDFLTSSELEDFLEAGSEMFCEISTKKLNNKELHSQADIGKSTAKLVEVYTPAKTPRNIQILHQNYRDLLLQEEDHDLILKVKDREFKVHRIIMQCRCPVFKSMLTHEMLEKSSGIVEIPDCDPNAFEQFLLYIYTGYLDTLDESIMLGLYYIADKYNMAYMKDKCREFIKESLSAHVVPDAIRLALNHDDSSLFEYATKYFVDNVKEILVTVEWQSFIKENPIQANELFIKAVK